MCFESLKFKAAEVSGVSASRRAIFWISGGLRTLVFEGSGVVYASRPLNIRGLSEEKSGNVRHGSAIGTRSYD